MAEQLVSGASLRLAARRNPTLRSTSGMAPGFLQVNLVCVPRPWAFDFLLFCQRNPTSCPIVEVVEWGTAAASISGERLDTALPGYRVWRDGVCVDEIDSAKACWPADGVSFLLGCSFSFESLLMDRGINLAHIQENTCVPMYLTNIPSMGTNRLHGRLVVSMRQVFPDQLARTVSICGSLPEAHGAPIHVGDPAEIGIADLFEPTYGDRPVVIDGGVSVFWACGVTPQAVFQASKIPFAITHIPGKMLITDVKVRGPGGLEFRSLDTAMALALLDEFKRRESERL